VTSCEAKNGFMQVFACDDSNSGHRHRRWWYHVQSWRVAMVVLEAVDSGFMSKVKNLKGFLFFEKRRVSWVVFTALYTSYFSILLPLTWINRIEEKGGNIVFNNFHNFNSRKEITIVDLERALSIFFVAQILV